MKTTNVGAATILIDSQFLIKRRLHFRKQMKVVIFFVRALLSLQLQFFAAAVVVAAAAAAK